MASHWVRGVCRTCGREMPLLRGECGRCRTLRLGTPSHKPPLPAGVAVWVGGEPYMEASRSASVLELPDGDGTVRIICTDARVWHDCGRLGRYLYTREGVVVEIVPAWELDDGES